MPHEHYSFGPRRTVFGSAYSSTAYTRWSVVVQYGRLHRRERPSSVVKILVASVPHRCSPLLLDHLLEVNAVSPAEFFFIIKKLVSKPLIHTDAIPLLLDQRQGISERKPPYFHQISNRTRRRSRNALLAVDHDPDGEVRSSAVLAAEFCLTDEIHRPWETR